VSIGKCRSCRAPIVWARTERGKRMPVDARPAADGTYRLDEPDRYEGPLAVYDPRGTGPRYASHFGTCPSAGQHRKAVQT
jgi:hypothetical protein